MLSTTTGRTLAAALFSLCAVSAGHAATFVVTNTTSVSTSGGCDADCSLHDAIAAANATTAADVIEFNVSGTGVKTITLDADGLPTITRPVTIDGYTQTGAAVNTATNGSNAVLTVALTRQNPDPINDTLTTALNFSTTATGSIVRGIAFVQMGTTTVSFIGTDADNMVIDGNFFGTNAAGDADGGQAPGVAISVNAAANNVTIGGNTAAARNLFAGIDQGIELFGTNATVQNNTFGLEDNGTTALALGDVAVLTSGDGHEIGGTDANEGNVFANIDSHAIQVSNTSNGNSLLGNSFRDSNNGLAINLQAAGDSGTQVTPNDSNDVDTGANNLQNFPLILSAIRSGTTTNVTFEMVSAGSRTFRIELYGSDSADPSGFGEGERFVHTLDVTTNATGFVPTIASVSGNGLPAGDFVTATATDLTTGETSEFSAAVAIGQTITVNAANDTNDGTCNATHCSLREAINAANADAAFDLIVFAIPGTGPHIITVGSTGLPDLEHPVDILGGSQSGFQANTRADGGNDAVRPIVISAPSMDAGLNVLVIDPSAAGSRLFDLTFRDTDSDANAMILSTADEVSILGCAFGVNASGQGDGGSSPIGSAIHVTGNGNSIGGTSVQGRLQFGGLRQALAISGTQNRVRNATFGLAADGSPTLPITGPATIVVTGANNDFDSLTESPIRIVGNTGHGIAVTSSAVGNRLHGIVFSNNGGLAIDLVAAGDPSSGVTPNDGADADLGANGLQNFPTITLAERNPDGTGVIQGSLVTNPVNGTQYDIRLFHNASADPSGHGEGETFLGSVISTVNAAGLGTFQLIPSGLPVGGFISATASRRTGSLDTSEFSLARALINAPIIVTNTNTSGTGSLHQAILTANAQTGADRIHFAIPGAGPHRIDTGATGLPTVTGTTDIDGTSQAGSVVNTSPQGFNAILQVELMANAPVDGNARLLEFGPDASNSRLRGLSLFRSGGAADSDGLVVTQTQGVAVEGNQFGTDATGNSPTNAGFGVSVYLDNTQGGTIGGSVAARNLFANSRTDMLLSGDETIVSANLVGRRRDGTLTPPGGGSGMFVAGTDLLIGGAGNLANQVAGHSVGILIFSGSAELKQNTIIEPGSQPINLGPSGPDTNDPLDADTGPSGLQNHPVITSASTIGGITLVEGRIDSTPSTSFRIELFASGETALGLATATQFLVDTTVTTNAQGTATFSVGVSPARALGSLVTATATDLSGPVGATSELSPPVAVTGPDLVVTSTNDTNDGTCNSTHCSLREAMIAANANADPTRIRFGIPGAGPTFTITPQAALPNITQPLILDGYSQPGATANSNAAPPNNAVIRIVLDGTAIAGLGTNPPMLEVQSSDVEIRGLSIVGMDDGSNGNEGISTPTNINLVTANVRVRGNFIGLLPDGTTVDANRTGVSLGGEAPDTGNEIGGPLPEHQNIIAGSSQHGITGTAAGLVIQNNLIGTARDGVTDRGNVGNGIQLGGAFSALVIDNVIAHNDNGVVVTNSGRGVEIDPNSIHSNADLGIDLGGTGATPNDPLDADTGANNLTNKPELVITASSGPNRTISMTLNARPSTNYFVSYYGERSCPGSGLGEGELLLDTDSHTTNAGGTVVASKSLSLPSGFAEVTAIATDQVTGETSEFSSCAVVLTDTVFANSFE